MVVRDNNDLAAGLARVLDDSASYYLLGYAPDAETFSAAKPRFHTITVRVNRPGVRVRSRRGFFGRADAPRPGSGTDALMSAILSPFTGGEIRLRLSSFFGLAEKTTPVVQSFMHLDARDLTFDESADGTRTADGDSKLQRSAAILPEMFASDADRLARFEREARTLATLNHAHIAAIYGFEESRGVRALILEFDEEKRWPTSSLEIRSLSRRRRSAAVATGIIPQHGVTITRMSFTGDSDRFLVPVAGRDTGPVPDLVLVMNWLATRPR